jgi:Signal transduction histidine kinase
MTALYGFLVLGLMVAVIAVSSALFLRVQALEEQRLSGAIAAILSEAIGRISFSGKYQARLLAEEMKARVPELEYISVEDTGGNIIAHSDPANDDGVAAPERRAIVERCLAAGAPVSEELRRNGKSVNEIVAPYRGGFDNEVVGVIRVGVGTSQERRRQLSTLGTLILLVAILGAFAIGVVLYLSRRFGGELRKLNAELEAKVVARTAALEDTNASLKRSNDELTRTLAELTATQSRLLQSERLAALGRLVAGLAHEINTPLGAVASANGSILASLDEDIGFFLDTARSFDEEEAKAFRALLAEGLARATDLGTIPDWREKKRVMASSAELGLELGRESAEMIVDMGLHRSERPLPELLPFRDRERALEAAHEAAMLKQSAVIVQEACERANNVVQALKYYSHRDADDETEELSIRRELENLVSLYRNKLKYGIEVITDYRDEGTVVGYRNRLNQVWMNLINNALQAMDGQGRLSLGIRREGERIVVTVSDSGPGIPEDIRSHIFEPFFTTKPIGEGTGLGLDICRKILEAHAADIDFDSSPSGTTFTVSLPAAGPAAESGKEAQA